LETLYPPAVLAEGSPSPLPPPPAPNHSKKFLVTNIGKTKALKCEGTMTKGLAFNVKMEWDYPNSNRQVFQHDLPRGIPEYLVLTARPFPTAGTYDIEIRVTAENMEDPAIYTCRLDVQSNTYPRWVDER
jgi:hypothetical protein